jgi:hypothetical protein
MSRSRKNNELLGYTTLDIDPRSKDITVFFVRPCERQKFLNFSFCEFRNCSVIKVQNFFGKKPGFPNLQKIQKKSLEISLGQKKPVFEAKTGVSKHSEFTEYSKLNSIPNFPKITKK